MTNLLVALIAYLIGSIPTGFLMAKMRGVDIRSVGSGNIGATNVFRILGKGPGVAVLLIDALKGFLPAKFLPALFLQGASMSSPPYQHLALIAVDHDEKVRDRALHEGGRRVTEHRPPRQRRSRSPSPRLPPGAAKTA